MIQDWRNWILTIVKQKEEIKSIEVDEADGIIFRGGKKKRILLQVARHEYIVRFQVVVIVIQDYYPKKTF